MLTIKNLCKNYHSKSGVTVKALDNVSLKFPKNGMVFILGKSGSGKSSLLNVLGGLDNFDSGDFYVKGKKVDHFKQSEFDSYRNTYVGFIFQEYNILDEFSVGQNIALAMQLQNQKPTSEDINEILKQVDLDGLGDRKPNELSGGQKQRVAIARALIKKPQIIMADEPTGALDSKTGIQIFDVLKKLSEDKLVVIVSHDREFSERYADRIIELKDGKVISDVSCSNKKASSKESNLVYRGDEIIVKKNYVLTASDLKEINNYLSSHKYDLKIKSGKTESSVSKGKFVDTDENKIETDNSGFQLIKSHLPLKRAFKMGSNGLKHKKFKLAMTIVLSLVSFTMLGLSMTMAMFNMQNTMSNALLSPDTNINYVSFKKSLFNSSDKQNYNYSENCFSDSDIDYIEKEIGATAIPVVSYNCSIDQDLIDDAFRYSCLLTSYNGAVNVNKLPTDLEGEGYGLAYGVLPKDNDKQEVAISEYAAYSLYYLSKTADKNKTIEQFIGKSIYLYGLGTEYGEEKFVITGIFKTRFNIMDTRYDEIRLSQEYSNSALFNELNSYKLNSIDNTIILPSKYMPQPRSDANYTYNRLVLPMLKTQDYVSKAVNFSLLKHAPTQDDISCWSEVSYIKLDLADPISSNIRNSANSFSIMFQIFLYMGLAFVLFSGLLLANFIANSISYQKKQIGILRAIGSRSSDIFKIYFAESFIIASINFILSTVASWLIMELAINPNFSKMCGGIKMFQFGILQVVIILGVSFVSAFLATVLPVRHIAKKRPIEAIRNK